MNEITFQEAVDYAKSRKVVLPSEYYNDLVGVQRSQAVSIAGLGSLEQIKYIIDALHDVLENGGTFKDFQDKVREETFSVALNKARLDNIFRTNLQSAYARGRYEQQRRNMSARPYLMYDAINDSRVRHSHAAMDGVVLHQTDPWWNTHYPPNGYRCRCTVISLSERQAVKRGISPVAPEVDPDEGWGYNPGLDYEDGPRNGLNEFGADLIERDAKIAKKVDDAKRKVREEAAKAKSDRSGAPRKPED